MRYSELLETILLDISVKGILSRTQPAANVTDSFVQWYGASNLLDSHQNAPVHVVVLPSPQKSCVIAVSRFDANKIFKRGWIMEPK
jgi:hypothetical protein